MTFYDQLIGNNILTNNSKFMFILDSEVCSSCKSDIINNKNIVIPDCGHPMHINCFCKLYENNLIHCSVCNKQMMEKKEIRVDSEPNSPTLWYLHTDYERKKMIHESIDQFPSSMFQLFRDCLSYLYKDVLIYPIPDNNIIDFSTFY